MNNWEMKRKYQAADAAGDCYRGKDRR